MDVKSEAKNEWFSLELKMAIEKKTKKTPINSLPVRLEISKGVSQNSCFSRISINTISIWPKGFHEKLGNFDFLLNLRNFN